MKLQVKHRLGMVLLSAGGDTFDLDRLELVAIVSLFVHASASAA
jgi:hypothetical protein